MYTLRDPLEVMTFLTRLVDWGATEDNAWHKVKACIGWKLNSQEPASRLDIPVAIDAGMLLSFVLCSPVHGIAGKDLLHLMPVCNSPPCSAHLSSKQLTRQHTDIGSCVRLEIVPLGVGTHSFQTVVSFELKANIAGS